MSNPNDFVIENGTLKKYQGIEGNVSIPSGLTGIGSYAFFRCKTLTSVTIPDGVTSIGFDAFNGCSNLKSIVIPDSVTSIGSAAFSECSSLTNTTIPNGLKNIENSVFHGCSSLTSVTIPDGVTSIGNHTFDGCCRLASIAIPDSVTSIGSYAFSGCRLLADSDGFLIVHGVLFRYYGEEVQITIPSGVSTIDNGAFYQCRDIMRVTIPDSVMIIGDSVFRQCYNLTDINIPNGVRIIGDHTFHNCRSLTRITIPESVTSIGNNAFEECSSLTSITIPNSVTSIGNYAFYKCCGLENITIPESVTSIGFDAFNGCSNLKKIKISGSVASIGACAFSGCEGLVDSDGMLIVNGILFGYYGSGAHVTIPYGVNNIERGAFERCRLLESVTIPDSVRSIGSDAFSYCVALTNVNIPESVSKIQMRTFNGCRLLKNITLPDGVMSIESSSFSDCRSLTSINIPYTVTSIGYEAFKNCINLERIDFSSVNTSFENDPFEDCNKLHICLPEGLVRTNKKIAAPFSRVCETLSEEDLAWVLLYQSAKCWKIEGYAAAKKKNAARILQYQLDLIRELKKPSSAAVSNVLEFCINLGQEVPADLIKEFVALLQEKNCAKQLAVLEADLTLMQKLMGSAAETAMSPVDRITKEKLESEGITPNDLFEKLNAMLGLKQDYLPELKDADGQICKPFVLAWLLTAHKIPEMISWNKTYCGKTGIKPEASEVVDLLDPESLQSALIALADQFLIKYQHTNKKNLVYPFCRYANEASMAVLTGRAPKWATSTSGSNAHPLRDLRDAVRYSDTRSAMLFAERYHELDKYAALRGTDADTLRDTVLADFGFDESGRKCYALGNGTVSVSMGSDLKLTLFDEKSQKHVKSIPKKGADPEKYDAAKKDLAQMNKNIKKVVKTRNDLLFEAYLSGGEFKADQWTDVYTGNPVLNAVARLLVWVQDGNSFTITDHSSVNAFGQEYEMKDAGIKLAHPMEMDPEEVSAWQKYFNVRGLKQPFAQVWEPVISLKAVMEDRYKGCMIPFYRLNGQEKHGIYVTEEGFHDYIGINFSDCDANVERVDERRHNIDVNDRFEITNFRLKTYTRRANHIVAYLDHVTVWDRVRKDDISVMDMMPGFTLAQITKFIKVAQEANAINVLAQLMDYKDSNFSGFNPMDEFTLEL